MRVQGCDAVQVAVLLGEVQTVTDHELGLDVPANAVSYTHLDVYKRQAQTRVKNQVLR